MVRGRGRGQPTIEGSTAIQRDGPRTRGGPIGLQRGGPRTRGGPIGLQMGGSSTMGGPTGLQRSGPITRTRGSGHVQGTVHTVIIWAFSVYTVSGQC